MGRRNHGKRNEDVRMRVSHRKQIELIRRRDLQTTIEHVNEIDRAHNMLVVELAALRQLVVEEFARLIGERARSGLLILPHGDPGLSTVDQLLARLDRIRRERVRQMLAELDAGTPATDEAPEATSSDDGATAPGNAA